MYAVNTIARIASTTRRYGSWLGDDITLRSNYDIRYQVRADIVRDVLESACALYVKTGSYEVSRALVNAAITARLAGRPYKISERSVMTAVRIEMKRRYYMGRLPVITEDK